ncbi:WD40 repeat domain-containing protein [Hanstruepera marina]|uniref:hypothetical protein n=1 Tax=Hanstruepera marina TaxID=2873265 RepID=UPI001CA62E16|nr:hypothetical protein [Hanstruepera marina]
MRIKRLLFFILSAQVFPVFCQNAETVIEADFVIRDFFIQQDSIIYIKKRDVHLYDIETKLSKDYFIGGYGLELITSKNTNQIITASNELVRNVSSVRFYNKETGKFDDVFYYKQGKILDFLLLPKSKLFILSLTNKKIIFVDYQDKPRFYRTIELNLNTLSRKLINKDNKLYFATDQGDIFEYDYRNYEKKLIYRSKALITDFKIENGILVYANIDGEIIKINLKTNQKEIINIKNTFINTFMRFNNNTLVCGAWSGEVFIVTLDNFSVNKTYKLHKRAIIKIKKVENNIIYSSSLDKTLKKWFLN